MNWNWQGQAWVFCHDIPNDEGLIPIAVSRQQEYDPQALKGHCMEQINSMFATNARPHGLRGRWGQLRIPVLWGDRESCRDQCRSDRLACVSERCRPAV